MAATLAEPGQRLLARVVDTLIVGVPVVLAVRAVASGHMVDVVAPPAVAGCMLLYEAVQLALWGRTLGKRFAGIEVVTAAPGDGQGAPGARGTGGARGAPGARGAAGEGRTAGAPETEEMGASGRAAVLPTSVPGFVPLAAPETDARKTGAPASEGTEGASVDEGAPPGVLQSVLRAAVYSLPLAARPIPVAGLLASVFWVANAGMLYEGTHRQAAHDRLAGTLVVKRPRPDSSAF
jgi:uncharacterized RDD family membrane protein YckC